MKNRIPLVVLSLLLATSAAADIYRDALSALNTGHFDVARQIASQLAAEHPERATMLKSIDAAAQSARQPRRYEASLEQLEQESRGKVFRSLEDPQMMEQLYAELDRSSREHANESGALSGDLFSHTQSGPITVEQQVALLKQKMENEPQVLSANTAPINDDLLLAELMDSDPATPLAPAVGQSTTTTETRQCLSKEEIKNYFSKARNDAAAFAMDKARAIANANEIRQQRALARMRLEITAELTRKIRADLDSRFDREVAERVSALMAGHQLRETAALGGTPLSAAKNPGQVELLLARETAGDGPLGSGDSLPWLQLAAQKGDAQAQYELGHWLFQPGSDLPDYQGAALWWERAKRAGHPDAGAALTLLRQRGLSPSLAAISPE